MRVKNFFQIAGVLAVLLMAGPDDAGGQLARVFVDCPECDDDYLRQELKFVDLVRDRRLADVVALVTSLPTGSGGRAYTLELAGARRADTLVVHVRPDATPTEQRESMVRALKQALLPFVRGTESEPHLDVVYRPPLLMEVQQGANDPWKRWVFRLGGSGSFADDESFSMRSGDGSVSASHVQEHIKVELSARGSYTRERFTLSEGETLIGKRHSWTARSLVVRSMGDHFSLGLVTVASSSAYQNIRLQVRAMPAIEYDVFPYAEATQRQLIVRYSAGLRANQYADTTIYHRIEESRPIHELSAVSDIRRPWGNVWGSALWSQYLHDTSKKRFTVEGGFDWRIVAGLSLNFSARYVMIRDQLNIVGTNLSDEERLLRLREVQSGHSTSAGLGLSYTFGSVFSNIVNPRFRL